MQGMLDFGINIILSLQNIGTWLTGPMKAITFLGDEEFFLLLAPVLYWCWDARLGFRMGLFLMMSGCLNEILKLAFHAPRPFWYDARVKALTTETSFGIPSGHAQHAVVVWGTLANSLRRSWIWVLAIGIIVLIGLSRLYLGMHFLTDVLAGWLIGTILLWASLKLEPALKTWLKRHTPAVQILVALGTSLLLILLGTTVKLSLGDWTIPQTWIDNANAAYPGAEPIDPLSLSRLVFATGTFYGMAMGGVILRVHGGFETRGLWWKLVARYAVGLAGLLLIWYGLGKVFPGGENLLAYSLQYLRYALVGVWITGLAPMSFQRLGLADAPK